MTYFNPYECGSVQRTLTIPMRTQFDNKIHVLENDPRQGFCKDRGQKVVYQKQYDQRPGIDYSNAPRMVNSRGDAYQTFGVFEGFGRK